MGAFFLLRNSPCRSFGAGLVCALGLLSCCAPLLSAATCDSGLELQLSSPALIQGSILLATVTSTVPITLVKAEWDGQETSFWQQGSRSTAWRALIGADLAKLSGPLELKITAQSRTGNALACTASIAISEGHFATENLHVATQFAEPDPEQLKRASEEGARLHEIYNTVTPERLWRGHFRLPLDGIKTGGNFGKRRVLNGHPGSPHTGVDFPAPTGTPVHASQSGRVVLADNLYFSGNAVIVDHGLGIYTFYCHFSAISVKVGDMVESGTVLGKVGATGRVTGPHLHWGLTVNRDRVNAIQIVKLLRD